ncbi:hypothetical protein [Peribacillus simplex]|uniref:hypothetical protein n=1 Tax=Peribacillus simplex TaxID=1478 RepID=UPI003D27AE24
MIEKVGKPKAVAADAASKTPAITSYLFGKEITPVLHSTRSKGNFKRGFYTLKSCHQDSSSWSIFFYGLYNWNVGHSHLPFQF